LSHTPVFVLAANEIKCKINGGLLMEETHDYSKGDWIVHAYYGIGKIKGIEVKCISGEESRYYKIQATDSTYWMPVDQIDSEALRPLATSEEMEQAIDVLQDPPKEMSSNQNTRKGRIKRVQLQNKPKSVARLVRDLQARQKEKGTLNQNERTAFSVLKQQLIEEWAIVSGLNSETVASELDALLAQQHLQEGD
jgi:RNA polymerase-interacting CarD/CdnL/TRCF family regulator